jgi:hypothetical protein
MNERVLVCSLLDGRETQDFFAHQTLIALAGDTPTSIRDDQETIHHCICGRSVAVR